MFTKFKKFLPFLALLALVMAAGCSPASPSAAAPTSTMPPFTPVTLTDGLGKSLQFDQPAQRVISLAPSNTEILFYLGGGNLLVGRDSLSDYPPEAAAVKDVGGGFGELDTETIVSLEPDLVLASELTPPEQVQALESLGLRVYYVLNPPDLEGMFETLRLVAQMTGLTAGLEEKIQALDQRVLVVMEKTAGLSVRPLVFYETDATDPNAPWTPGKDTYVANLIALAGGDNLGDQVEGTWVQISIEALVAGDPDLILLGDSFWGGVTPEQVAARAGWESLKAVKEGRVYSFDDNLVSRPGPRMVDGLEALAKLMHPDLFE